MLPGAALLGVAVGKARFDVEVATMTTEATTHLGVGPHVGFASALGLFAWAAASGAALLGASLLTRSGRPREVGLLRAVAALTLFLLLDDAFTVHEAVLPAIGIPEILTYTVLVGVTAAILLRHVREILAGPWTLLLAALILLGGSVVWDVVTQHLDGVGLGYNIEVFVEDGLKLFGIAFWTAWVGAQAHDAVRARFDAAGATPGSPHLPSSAPGN
ncbi:hypothetical protein [Mobilicoccus caccae]|nr:hypothetical protein [Mobilicoccus caccae]